MMRQADTGQPSSEPPSHADPSVVSAIDARRGRHRIDIVQFQPHVARDPPVVAASGQKGIEAIIEVARIPRLRESTPHVCRSVDNRCPSNEYFFQLRAVQVPRVAAGVLQVKPMVRDQPRTANPEPNHGRRHRVPWDCRDLITAAALVAINTSRDTRVSAPWLSGSRPAAGTRLLAYLRNSFPCPRSALRGPQSSSCPRSGPRVRPATGKKRAFLRLHDRHTHTLMQLIPLSFCHYGDEASPSLAAPRTPGEGASTSPLASASGAAAARYLPPVGHRRSAADPTHLVEAAHGRRHSRPAAPG